MSASTDEVEPGAVVFEANHLEPGDPVKVARDGYEWSNPLEVEAVDVIEWLDEHGSVAFGTARVKLFSPASPVDGQPHVIDAVSGSRAEWRQGEVQDDLVRFEVVDVADEPEADDDSTAKYGDEFPCQDCDRSFGTEHGRNIHRGQVHGSNDELTERAIDDLEEVAAEKADDTDDEEDNVGDDDADVATKGFADADEQLDEDRVTYPFVCTCGVVCDDSLEKHIHRTEAHETPQCNFDYLEPGEFVELIDEHDSISELADSLDWSTGRLLRVLGIYGFDGVVTGDGLPEDPAASNDLLSLGANANGMEVTSTDV